jgi:putative sigma-54 modulation protein
MNIKYLANGFEFTELQRKFIEKKLKKLVVYFPEETVEVTITVTVQEKNSYAVEMLLFTNGVTLYQTEKNNDLKAAVDLVVDKIIKQVSVKINFVTKGLELTDAMRSFTGKKLDKLSKYLPDEVIEITVTINVHHKASCYTVEVLAFTKGLILKGIETNDDAYTAIDLSIEKIEKQVSKYKKRIEGRKHTEHANTIKMSVYEAKSLEREMPRKIIAKDVGTKPMDVNEAVMQMDLMNKNFFVFKDLAGSIRVVYRRDDGDIGLFEQ